MQINAQQRTYGPTVPYEAARIATSGNSGAATTASSGAPDKVDLSSSARLLSNLPPLLLPNRENVKTLSKSLMEELKAGLASAGIETTPPIEFAVDPYTGEVSIKGGRPDTPQIAAWLKANPDVEHRIQSIAAMASHIGPIEKALEADAAYRAARNPTDVAAVVARYASVYAGQTAVSQFSLIFDGTDIQILADGQPWSSSRP